MLSYIYIFFLLVMNGKHGVENKAVVKGFISLTIAISPIKLKV